MDGSITAITWKMLLSAVLVSIGGLFAAGAHAASLEISPVLIILAPGQTAATVEVMNHGDVPAAVQARAYHWAQVGDDDPLTPTQEVILSPPIFTIPEGASQTVRLLLRGGPKATGERTFRLLIDEVPPADAKNKEIVIALRVSLPVFVDAAASPPAKLQWRAARDPGGHVVLTAANPGQAHDTVGALDVTLADGSHPKVVPLGKNPYVLPGAERRWTVEGSGVPAGTLQLSVVSQAGKIEQTLAIP